jgi:cytoskeletal protein CcmA (bactofilin family)
MTHSSLIGAGTQLSGRLTTESDLRIEGRIAGEITVRGDLTVGAEARVDGPLRARSVTVAGAVLGTVHGEERVEIVRGGSVEGNVRSACVVLGEGSELDGQIELDPLAG